jgi:hydroxypyruvate isomerase
MRILFRAMPLTRRSALKGLAAASALGLGANAQETDPITLTTAKDALHLYRAKNGRIRQSVVPWCFNPMPVLELAQHAAKLGIESVELCDPKFWPELKALGLTCAIAGSHGFAKGFAHREEWDECHAVLRKRIDECATAGVERVITFSGFRRGISDREGMANMVEGLKTIAPLAEEKKVTLCIEMLNSRVDVQKKGHPDYFCDYMDRTVEICRRIGSERVK